MTPRKAKKDLLKLGRHTGYKPEYCEMLINHRASGRSYETFAAIVGCSISTLYNWEVAHPDFMEAKEIALPLALAKWEDMGIAGTAGKLKGFNATSYVYIMKNRFPKQYRENPAEELNFNVKIVVASDEQDL